MMGRSHALTGMATGAGLTTALGITNPGQAVVFTLTTAGYALLPDIDHPNATASKAFEPVTGWVSSAFRGLSTWVYRRTATPHDDTTDGTHRHLTHTVVFALVLGALAGAAGAASPWAAATVALLGIGLGALAVGPAVGYLGGAAAGLWAATHQFNPDAMAAALQGLGWQMGLAVAVGCIVHDLGDALTLSGCPFLFPLRFHGERWYELGPPRWMRFRTGTWPEVVVCTASVAATAWALWPLVGDDVLALWNQIRHAATTA